VDPLDQEGSVLIVNVHVFLRQNMPGCMGEHLKRCWIFTGHHLAGLQLLATSAHFISLILTLEIVENYAIDVRLLAKQQDW